jgi:hypothetical protein
MSLDRARRSLRPTRHGCFANPDDAVEIDHQPINVKARRLRASLERFGRV